MPEVTGVLETSLYVEDPERSAGFYQRIFQFKTLAVDDRAWILNVADRQVLLLFRRGYCGQPNPTPGGVIPGHDGSGQLHVAFAISGEQYESWKRSIEENGVAIESEVSWLKGGRSLYFRDPDRHLVELVTPGTWSIY